MSRKVVRKTRTSVEAEQKQIKSSAKFDKTLRFNLTPKTQGQEQLIKALESAAMVIAEGCAGTGKTYVSCAHASKRLINNDISKIILIRAYQPLAGRTIGFIPGTLEEKLYPYYLQMIEYLEDFLGKENVALWLKSGKIEICSLETVRGRSWHNAAVIVDESQNLFKEEVEALTTRLGDNCQMIFCGDDSGTQTDVKGENGLTYLKRIIQKYNIEDSQSVIFYPADIIRSNIVKQFVLAYHSEYLNKGKKTRIAKSTKTLNEDKPLQSGSIEK